MFFIVDIIINFRTYYIKDGAPVTDHKSVAKNYMNSTFWIDIIASFPFSLIAEREVMNIIGLLRLIRFYRLKKLEN